MSDQRLELEAVLEARFADVPGAVLALDPARAELLWANRPGKAVLGHTGDAAPWPVTLDRAMPALARLRDAHPEARGRQLPAPFLFWGPNGPVTVLAHAEHLTTSSDRTIIALVEAQPGAARDRPDQVDLGTLVEQKAHRGEDDELDDARVVLIGDPSAAGRTEKPRVSRNVQRASASELNRAIVKPVPSGPRDGRAQSDSLAPGPMRTPPRSVAREAIARASSGSGKAASPGTGPDTRSRSNARESEATLAAIAEEIRRREDGQFAGCGNGAGTAAFRQPQPNGHGPTGEQKTGKQTEGHAGSISIAEFIEPLPHPAAIISGSKVTSANRAWKNLFPSEQAHADVLALCTRAARSRNRAVVSEIRLAGADRKGGKILKCGARQIGNAQTAQSKNDTMVLIEPVVEGPPTPAPQAGSHEISDELVDMSRQLLDVVARPATAIDRRRVRRLTKQIRIVARRSTDAPQHANEAPCLSRQTQDSAGPERTSLSQTIEAVQKRLKVRAGRRSPRLDCQDLASLPDIAASEIILRQVILAILDWATLGVAHGARVRISTSQETANRVRLMVDCAIATDASNEPPATYLLARDMVAQTGIRLFHRIRRSKHAGGRPDGQPHLEVVLDLPVCR